MTTQPETNVRTSQPRREWKGIAALIGLLVCVAIIVAPMFPTRVVPASASAEEFSAERAMTHLPVIASVPHPQGSPAQALVRDYLVAQMNDLGLEVEVQKISTLENIVARLPGTDPDGAILILAHYDSTSFSPGGADNGSAVATLVEIMRALASGPALRNDVIALFDDGEEYPDVFAGSSAFVRSHPWMAEVRVAIGMDTAVRGSISTDDTGSENGWMTGVLARAYTGGAWYSISGGGTYDSVPFRNAGIQVLELEDNYPFYQQHGLDDTPEIVNPASVQQLGEQAVSVIRVLGDMDLDETKAPPHVYASFSFLGFVHYPEAWSLPLAILACALFLGALILALLRRMASWRGMGIALLATALMAGLSFLGADSLWKELIRRLGWGFSKFPNWPEVIPPHGWLVFLSSNLIVILLFVLVYRLARRWIKRADLSLVGLLVTVSLNVLFVFEKTNSTLITTWPAILGCAGWLAAALVRPGKGEWHEDLGSLATAIPTAMLLVPLLFMVFTGDGTKSVAMISGLLVLFLAMTFPAIDPLLVWRARKVK